MARRSVLLMPDPFPPASNCPRSVPLSGCAFYLIESRWRQQRFIFETDLARADLAAIVEQVATGEFDTGTIAAIYRCDPAAGLMRDDTLTVLEQVGRYLDRTRIIPCEAVASLLWHNGIGYASHPGVAE